MNEEKNGVFVKMSAETFRQLYQEKIPDDKIEKKSDGTKELSYLSWSYAVELMGKKFDDFNFAVKFFDGKPYLFDENLGYMVMTSVTAGGKTMECWLPVMDAKNKAMRHVAYKYATKNGDKTVAPATMIDVNKSLMRCLTKNIAMFGLGLCLYSGEDIPQEELVNQNKAKSQTAPAIKKTTQAPAKPAQAPVKKEPVPVPLATIEQILLQTPSKKNNDAKAIWKKCEEIKWLDKQGNPITANKIKKWVEDGNL